jgi:hypothetical protein
MTRDEMVSYICDRLVISANDTARIALIVDQLDLAHRRVVAEEGLIQKVGTLNTVAGTATITLPTDWHRIRAIAEGTTVLNEVSFQELAGLDMPDDANHVYVILGATQIMLHPTPTESVTGALTIYYDAYPTAMSTGSSTPEGIPEAYHEIVPEMALARVAIAEEEPVLAQAAQQFVMELRLGLRTLTHRRSGQRPAQIPVPGLRRH